MVRLRCPSAAFDLSFEVEWEAQFVFDAANAASRTERYHGHLVFSEVGACHSHPRFWLRAVPPSLLRERVSMRACALEQVASHNEVDEYDLTIRFCSRPQVFS